MKAIINITHRNTSREGLITRHYLSKPSVKRRILRQGYFENRLFTNTISSIRIELVFGRNERLTEKKASLLTSSLLLLFCSSNWKRIVRLRLADFKRDLHRPSGPYGTPPRMMWCLLSTGVKSVRGTVFLIWAEKGQRDWSDEIFMPAWVKLKLLFRVGSAPSSGSSKMGAKSTGAPSKGKECQSHASSICILEMDLHFSSVPLFELLSDPQLGLQAFPV